MPRGWGLREVNFWRPSGGGRFGALSVGEPFFFKTHYPDNRVVGGGFYSDFAAMTASEAWALFGEGNGAPSLEQMLARVSHYRRTPIAPGEDPTIGRQCSSGTSASSRLMNPRRRPLTSQPTPCRARATT